MSVPCMVRAKPHTSTFTVFFISLFQAFSFLSPRFFKIFSRPVFCAAPWLTERLEETNTSYDTYLYTPCHYQSNPTHKYRYSCHYSCCNTRLCDKHLLELGIRWCLFKSNVEERKFHRCLGIKSGTQYSVVCICTELCRLLMCGDDSLIGPIDSLDTFKSRSKSKIWTALHLTPTMSFLLCLAE